MSKKIYPYVEDEEFLEKVKVVLDTVSRSSENIEDTIHSNVVDPFSALFDSVAQDISYKDWILQEKNRQLQKTFQNYIGYFHQDILGLVNGWDNPGIGGGYDIENKKKKIIAEIKNKHNTLNAASGDSTYEKLSKFLEKDKPGFTAYVVFVLPKNKNRFNKPFSPSGKEVRDDIRQVDGATFYEMVTGDKEALKKLFESIPEAVEKIRGRKNFKTKTKDFQDLFIRAYGE